MVTDTGTHTDTDVDQPWLRIDGETAKAFEAFKVYRDLGPTRSIAKAAQKLGKAAVTLHAWSSRNDWVIRADAWDREDDRLFLVEVAEQKKSVARRHVNIAQMAQTKIIQRLQALDPDDLTPSQLIRWLEVTAKIERAALGVSDHLDVISHDTLTADVDALSPEEVAAELAMIQAAIGEELANSTIVDPDEEWQP
jgi:hypothetical protein